jgi:copper(I)-binding protein
MKIIKKNVMITSGTVIEMKLGELAECFLIIAEKINLCLKRGGYHLLKKWDNV